MRPCATKRGPLPWSRSRGCSRCKSLQAQCCATALAWPPRGTGKLRAPAVRGGPRRMREPREDAVSTLEDMAAGFSSAPPVLRRVQDFKARFPAQYTRARVSEALPSLMSVYVTPQLLHWACCTPPVRTGGQPRHAFCILETMNGSGISRKFLALVRSPPFPPPDLEGTGILKF